MILGQSSYFITLLYSYSIVTLLLYYIDIIYGLGYILSSDWIVWFNYNPTNIA